jgi:methyl-accepting chemotaxis protein
MSGQKSLVDEVNAASHEQKRGLDPIAGSIPQVEQFTQKTAASAGQNTAAGQKLNAQADTLLGPFFCVAAGLYGN